MASTTVPARPARASTSASASRVGYPASPTSVPRRGCRRAGRSPADGPRARHAHGPVHLEHSARRRAARLATKNPALEARGAQGAGASEDPRRPRRLSTRDFAFQASTWPRSMRSSRRAGSSATPRCLRPAAAFKKELELFMDDPALRRSVVDLLTADHTYINEQIAQLYGLTDVRGNGFRRVTLTDPKRFGLPARGAILTLTATPTARPCCAARGSGAPPRYAPSGAAAQRRAAPANVGGRAATVRERTKCTRATRRARAAMPSWTRSASPWRTSTPLASSTRLMPVAPAHRYGRRDARRTKLSVRRTCRRPSPPEATSSPRSSRRS